jgi:pimeloyl-ACP methyl ester carboxylesterase
LSGHEDSYGYADYERDLVQIMDRLELDQVTAAGHSLGGYVALLAASQASGSPACWRSMSRATGRTRMRRSWSAREARCSGSRPSERCWSTGSPGASRQPSLGADELEIAAERGIEPVEGGWRFRWDRRVLATEPVDPFAFLARVRCPTHVMAGSESDVMPPDSARRFAEAIPGGTVEIVDGAGHHLELEAPEVVAERILD